MRKFLLFLFAFLPALSWAQYTNVTATVKDVSGNIYANCNVNTFYVNQSSASVLPNLSGSPFQTEVPAVQCTSAGTFAVRLADNNSISPTPSQWKFSICSQNFAACFTYQTTITGASQDITSGITAVAASLTPAIIASGSLKGITDPWFDVRAPAFGAKCDNVTDDSGAIQTAIAALPTWGGTIIIYGSCRFGTHLDLTVRSGGVKFRGFGGYGVGYGSTPKSSLIYTGTEARAIDARGMNGMAFYDMEIRYSNPAFTGKLIDFGGNGSTNAGEWVLRDCIIRGTPVQLGTLANSAAALLNIQGAIIGTIDHNYFQFGVAGISGNDGSGGQANHINIVHNLFDNMAQDRGAIENIGQQWRIEGNIFEGTNSGMRALNDTLATNVQQPQNLSFKGNNMQDSVNIGAAGWIVINSPIGGSFEDNFITTPLPANSMCVTFRGAGVSVQGWGDVTFKGNSMCPIDLGLVANGIGHDITITNNNFGVTNKTFPPVVNTTGHMRLTVENNEVYAGSGQWADVFIPRYVHEGNITAGRMFAQPFGYYQQGGQTKFAKTPSLPGGGPGSLSIACAGGVTGTTYNYWLWPKDRNGFRAQATSASISCAASLDATHYVILSIPSRRNTTVDGGYYGCDVAKTAQTTTIGSCVYNDNISAFGDGWMLKDTGQGTSAYVPPTHDESADVFVDGNYSAGTLGSVTLVDRQGPASAIVGTGADATLYTTSLDASRIGPGKCLNVTLGFQKTLGTASQTNKIILGTTAYFTSLGSTSNGPTVVTASICNLINVQNSQFSETIWTLDNTAPRVFTGTTGAENTANTLTIKATFNVAATDQVTPQFWKVTLDQ